MTWLNVQLVDPIVLQHQERYDVVVVSHPDHALEKNDLSEPGAHLVLVCTGGGISRTDAARERSHTPANSSAS